MKDFTSTVFLFLFFCSINQAQTANISVEVRNVQYITGSIKLGIFDKVHNYRTKSDPYVRASQAATDSVAHFIFENVPFGRYAIATYHDENGDDSLNTKKLGIPIEGIGFSGIFNSRIKPPDFNMASFHLKADTTIIVKMNYNKRKN